MLFISISDILLGTKPSTCCYLKQNVKFSATTSQQIRNQDHFCNAFESNNNKLLSFLSRHYRGIFLLKNNTKHLIKMRCQKGRNKNVNLLEKGKTFKKKEKKKKKKKGREKQLARH